jgi:spectinomycin phosphotransferase
VTDDSGVHWFATARALGGDDDFADLTAAMSAASALGDLGLDFVVAPVRSVSGQSVVRVRPDYAMTLYRYADGTPGHWGDALGQADREAVVRMVAALHHIPVGLCTLPVRSIALSGANVLQAALRERDTRWDGGPFSEPARTVVSGDADGLQGALRRFTQLAAQVAGEGAAPVITHGEPHAGNLVRQGTRFLLVDWDTAGLAPPERDLWWVLSPSGDEARLYASLTGRDVSPAAVDLFRLRWDLDDICLYLAKLRAGHERNRDTEVVFAGLADAVRRVAAQPEIRGA